MLSYMDDNNILVEEVACVFPNTAEFKLMELNSDLRKHQIKDLKVNKYVLYSNVYNDYVIEEIMQLENEFILIKEFKKHGVFIRLYKNTYK